MKKLFQDLPEAILNIQKLIDKIEFFQLNRDVLLPKFHIPEAHIVDNDVDGKKGENNYLRFLTYEGAKKRYTTLTEDIRYITKNVWLYINEENPNDKDIAEKADFSLKN